MKSDLIIKTVLSISLILILVASIFEHWIKQKICVEHTFIVLTNIHVMTDVPYIAFWFIYNKWLIQYLISLDGEVVIAHCSMPIPESDFNLLKLFFKVHLSKIITDVFIYWYWMTYDQICIVYVFVNRSES